MARPTECIDCGSSDIEGPDFEGFYDCHACGAAWVPGREAHKLNMWEN